MIISWRHPLITNVALTLFAFCLSVKIHNIIRCAHHFIRLAKSIKTGVKLSILTYNTQSRLITHDCDLQLITENWSVFDLYYVSVV